MFLGLLQFVKVWSVTADDSCLWSHLPHAKLSGCEVYLCNCYVAPRSSTVSADIRPYTALQLVTMRAELDPSPIVTDNDFKQGCTLFADFSMLTCEAAASTVAQTWHQDSTQYCQLLRSKKPKSRRANMILLYADDIFLVCDESLRAAVILIALMACWTQNWLVGLLLQAVPVPGSKLKSGCQKACPCPPSFNISRPLS